MSWGEIVLALLGAVAWTTFCILSVGWLAWKFMPPRESDDDK